MRATTYTLLILALLVAVLASTGCQAIAEKAVEQATGVKVDKQGNSVTVEGEDGKTTVGGEGTSIPSDWPDDIPIYPDTKVVTTVDTEFDGARTFGVTLDSTDDGKTINDWYVTEVAKNGWKITAKASTDGNYVISATKNDNQLTVAIAADLGTENTGINLMVSPMN